MPSIIFTPTNTSGSVKAGGHVISCSLGNDIHALSIADYMLGSYNLFVYHVNAPVSDC